MAQGTYAPALSANEPLTESRRNAVVNSVGLESPADDAGLKPGDVITRINSRVIKSASDAINAFGSVLVGETFTIDVLRKDKELHLTLTAAQAKGK